MTRWLLVLMLAMVGAGMPGPVAACATMRPTDTPAEGFEPFQAEVWLMPDTGWSRDIEAPDGYLVIEADAPTDWSADPVTISLNRPTPGGCNSTTIWEVPLGNEPVAGRWWLEPGAYTVHVLYLNRSIYRHADDPAFERLIRIAVRSERD
jgi:hypothetical protein